MVDYVLTYDGCDFIAEAMAGSGKTPNCMYAVFENSSNPTALILTPDMDYSYFQNMSGKGYFRAVNKTVPYLAETPTGSPYRHNKVTYSSIVSAEDVKKGTPNTDVTSASNSRLIAVALVYAPDIYDVSKDRILCVANMTISGVIYPVRCVPNANMTVSCPLIFGTVEAESEDSSSSAE